MCVCVCVCVCGWVCVGGWWVGEEGKVFLGCMQDRFFLLLIFYSGSRGNEFYDHLMCLHLFFPPSFFPFFFFWFFSVFVRGEGWRVSLAQARQK